MKLLKRIIPVLIISFLLLSCTEEHYTVTTKPSPSHGGTVSPLSGSYEKGEMLIVEAIPYEGWKFSGWEGDIQSPHNRVNIAVQNNYTIVGLFERLSDELVFDIDENDYGMVAIGEQVWMSENLRTSRYSNGDRIDHITDGDQWSRANRGAWSYYDNDRNNNIPYGKLYNWYAVNDERGLCPDGWRVPNHDDWGELVYYLGSNEGGKLKAKGTNYWRSPNIGATNATGFSGLPGGSRYGTGTYYGLGNSGGWWSATEAGSDIAWRWYLHTNADFMVRYYGDKRNGFSVRCIRK